VFTGAPWWGVLFRRGINMAMAFVTFDLSRETLDYKTAYRILGELGLSTTEPEGNTWLPNTSAMGEVPDTWTAEYLTQVVSERFRADGVNLTALFSALVSGYAGIGEKVDRQALLVQALRNFVQKKK
jgi:hypothetical protein